MRFTRSIKFEYVENDIPIPVKEGYTYSNFIVELKSNDPTSFFGKRWIFFFSLKRDFLVVFELDFLVLWRFDLHLLIWS